MIDRSIIKLGSPPGGGLGHQVVTRQPRLLKNDHFLRAIAVGTSIFRAYKKGVGRARILSVRASRSKCCPFGSTDPGEVRPKLANTNPEPDGVHEKNNFFLQRIKERCQKSVFFKSQCLSVSGHKNYAFFETNPAEVMMSEFDLRPRGH